MFFLLLKFAYIILLAHIYGTAASDMLSRLLLRRRLESMSFSLVCISGLIALNCMATWLSIGLPMGAAANVLVLGVGILLTLSYRRNLFSAWTRAFQQARSATPVVMVSGSLSVLFILYFSSLQSITYDEGLYYSQFIRWTQTYAVVPGLANLHDRFGFNSSWHVLAALFNFSGLTGQDVNQVNGVLYVLTSLYLLGGFRDNRVISAGRAHVPAALSGAHERAPLSRILKLGLLVLINMPWVAVYNFIAPAADLVVFYLLSLMIVVWLEHLERGERLLDGPGAVLIWIVPAYLLTVKLSALPVLLLPAMLCWAALQQKKYRAAGGLVFVGLLLVTPWLARNVILSGYLLFPFERLNLFAVDWKVPVAKVRQTREAIEAFGYLRNEVSAAAVHTRLDRLRFLFRHNIRPYDLVLLMAVPLSPIVAWWRRRLLPRGWVGLFVFIWIGIGFWFIQAPDPRFGYGYLAALAVLVPALCLPRLRAALWFLLAALVFQMGSLFLYRHLRTSILSEGTIVESPRRSLWLLPQPYAAPAVDTHQEPFLYYTPAHLDLCWGTDLPCADQTREDIRLRGATLSGGFAPVGAKADTTSDFIPLTLPVGKGAGSVEVTDLNKDGFPDIVVANMDDSSVSILLGDGHDHFTSAPGSPFFCNEHPNDIVLADLNHDGNIDLGIANTEVGLLTVLLGNGRGQFAPARGFPVYVKPHTHGIAAGDFNGDGHPDLATDSWGYNRILLLFGDGQGNFGHEDSIQVGLHPYQRVRAADVNQDGKPDIVTTNLDGDDVSVMLGNGDGTFRGAKFAAGDMPFAVAIGDVNGDGHPDLAVANSPSITSEKRGRDGLTILLGDGRGEFSQMGGSPFATGRSPSRVAIGDLDGDGIGDIAVTNYNDRSITLFYMRADGVKSTRTIPVGNQPDGIAIHDMNGDGQGEIVVSNSGDNTVLVLLSHPENPHR